MYPAPVMLAQHGVAACWTSFWLTKGGLCLVIRICPAIGDTNAHRLVGLRLDRTVAWSSWTCSTELQEVFRQRERGCMPTWVVPRGSSCAVEQTRWWEVNLALLGRGRPAERLAATRRGMFALQPRPWIATPDCLAALAAASPDAGLIFAY